MSTLPVPKQVVVDVLIFMTLCLPMLGVLLWGQPVRTGFWCRDESLTYPYKPDTIPQSALMVIGFGGPFLVMAITESVRAFLKSRVTRQFRTDMYCLAKAYGIFLFGVAANCIFTDTVKFSVGRLRPHFFDLCKPDFDKINCTSHADGMDSTSFRSVSEPMEEKNFVPEDFIRPVMDTRDLCQDVDAYHALLVVHSANTHFRHRQDYRNTYGNANFTQPYRLKLVFFLGLTSDPEVMSDLRLENTHLGDTVILNHLDTYHNLTHKAVAVYRWMATNCRRAGLIVKMDDDVLFDVHKFFEVFWPPAAHHQDVIYCHVWHHAQVERRGKWRVSKGDYRRREFPSYCSGFLVVLVNSLVDDMYQTAMSTRFLWLDDVFIYGLVLQAMGSVQLIGIDHLAWRVNMHEHCVRRFVLDYECTNTMVDSKLIRDSGLSFPSGHASLSVYSAIFTILYLQLRMEVSFSHLLRPTLQLCLMLLAVLCCVTRVNDHKHFTTDVIAGSLIGLTFGWLTFYKLGSKLIPNVEKSRNACLARALSVESEPQTPTPLLRPERLVLNHHNNYRHSSAGPVVSKEDFVNRV